MKKPDIVAKHGVVLLQTLVWFPEEDRPYPWEYLRLIEPDALKEKALRDFYVEDLSVSFHQMAEEYSDAPKDS